MRDENSVSTTVRCPTCGAAVPYYDAVNYGSIEEGYRVLCTRCFNAEVADALGLEGFENVSLQPIVMTDYAGERREFHFRMRLNEAMAVLDAFELRDGAPGGYQFSIVGGLEDEALALLGRLIERMRRSLSLRHLEHGDLGRRIADRRVCGRVDWDESRNGRVPLLVIDGQEVSWDEMGRMLMTFEGWQFRLDIVDPCEEIPRS